LDAAAAAANVPIALLMERAGAAVARAARRFAPLRRVTILTGAGHNGGDGYEAARFLHAHGVAVTLIETTETPKALAAAARARLLREAPDLPRSPLAAPDPAAFERVDLVIDALLGVGVTRPVNEAWRALFARVRACGAPVLAVDVPSGVNADDAASPEAVLDATATVQLGAAKPASLFAPARVHYGRWSVDDLGIPRDVVARFACGWIARHAAVTPRRADAHKFRSGVVLIAGGSQPHRGGGGWAGRAAYRAGAGYVELAAAERAASAWPEVVATPLTPAALTRSRADVAVLGPGLAPDAAAALLQAWGGRPAVLDGGMLHELPPATRTLRVLTPHAGEAARLLGAQAEWIERDPLAGAVTLARRAGCWVVLKGSCTVIAAANDTAPTVVPGGGAALAVAGSGDVLAGVIGALLAPMRGDEGDVRGALIAAVAMHAEAARIALARLAPLGAPSAGLIASDVIDALPAARGIFERASSVVAAPWRW
jgi:ADP-dependent NAD(P)H-hydrate dehydratase / NAD(P)H-hydrate epimerase